MFSASGKAQNDQMAVLIIVLVSHGEIILLSESKKFQSVESKLLKINVKFLQKGYSVNNVITSFPLHPQIHLVWLWEEMT